jgi:hypothetical protein
MYQHPYMQYEHSSLWKIIEKAIEELIINQDLVLETRKEYVIGYICQAIERKQAVKITCAEACEAFDIEH